MNLINRAIVVVLVIGAIIFSCISLFALLFAKGGIQSALDPILRQLSDASINVTQLLCMGVTILIFAIGILLLYLELMPSGRMRMRLKSIQGAEVMMSSDAITTQLAYALDAVQGVIRVTPRVAKGKGDTLDIFADMVTTADMDIKKKTEELTDVARNVAEGTLGLRVGKIQIRVEQLKPARKGNVPIAVADLPRLRPPSTEESTTTETPSS